MTKVVKYNARLAGAAHVIMLNRWNSEDKAEIGLPCYISDHALVSGGTEFRRRWTYHVDAEMIVFE